MVAVRYEADGDDKFLELLNDFGGEWGKTRVSIQMPRWASRIQLEITGLRVERLKQGTIEDAKAVGLQDITGGNWIEKWKELWESINGEGSWDANPWTWVVEFRRV